MSHLITLAKSSPEFIKHLDGSFSRTHRALPLETLNANSSDETVTFKVIATDKLEKPNSLECWLQAIKLRSFLIVLFPVYIMTVKNFVDHRIKEPTALILSILGILLLYAGVNLRNEYSDHMLGFDRIFPYAGSRVLQKGFLTAISVKRMSWIFFALSALCSFPLVMIFPELIVTLILTVFVFFWAVIVDRSNFKYHKGGEISVFLLMGPLLTCGYDVSITGGASAESVALGILWGWLCVFLVHLNNLESILHYSKAKFLNTVTYLGFDKSKRMIARWWTIFVLLFSLYHFFYLGFYWFWFFTITLIFLSIRFVYKTLSLRGPLGSDLSRLKRRGYYLFLIVIILWTVESIWLLTSAS